MNLGAPIGRLIQAEEKLREHVSPARGDSFSQPVPLPASSLLPMTSSAFCFCCFSFLSSCCCCCSPSSPSLLLPDGPKPCDHVLFQHASGGVPSLVPNRGHGSMHDKIRLAPQHTHGRRFDHHSELRQVKLVALDAAMPRKTNQGSTRIEKVLWSSVSNKHITVGGGKRNGLHIQRPISISHAA